MNGRDGVAVRVAARHAFVLGAVDQRADHDVVAGVGDELPDRREGKLPGDGVVHVTEVDDYEAAARALSLARDDIAALVEGPRDPSDGPLLSMPFAMLLAEPADAADPPSRPARRGAGRSR